MNEDRASVRIVDVFDFPREVVFAAWTEPERLKRWWGPGFFETVSAEIDLRPGGRYELLLEPGSMRLVGEFREVTAPRRLVYTWRWVEGVPDTRESLVTVEFREHGARTEVVLVHDNFVGPGPVDMYDEGWRSGLSKLRAFLRAKETTGAQCH
ncbi:MAG: SRPBCC domain-containing protein [Solirubrobacterales bacterium]|nr:SRPBCC domain-containing protein [Solirubrobacterales bacterium]MBV9367107.1 SRPBCC domain-containing protein [Solirubrobacterales bacterium]MBV9810929.1 SRPBCC domain-containing protein [Solirubrobacterales bacterium]